MIELPLVFLGGLLGSAHCVGMCGGFAITLGSAAATWRANLLRQLLFGLGRIFTYVAIGAAAGFGGRRLLQIAPFDRMQSWLALGAGVFLVGHGLMATGWIPRRKATVGRPVCLQLGLLSTLLRTRGGAAAVVAGIITGLMPCGLVYAFLALAVSGGTMGRGMAVMACFGLGTMPLLTLFGLGTSLAGLALRQRMLQAAAWCIVLTGAFSIARGSGALTSSGSQAELTCPFCVRSAADSDSPMENKAAVANTPMNVNTMINKPTP